MDPRFRRRRIEVRRTEGRHRLRVLVGITTVVALGAGGWAATGSRLLDVDHITVEGAAHTEPGRASAASGLRRGERMLDVDEGAAARAVRSLPWVQGATVQLHWPGQVRIRVVERVAVAVAPADGGASALVDASGRVLEWVDGRPPGLALLAGLPPAGPPGSVLARAGVAALRVATVIPPELRDRVTGVVPAAGDTGEVELRLAPEGTVRLGPPEDLGPKFDALRAVLAQVDLRNLAVLDVRTPDSPILTRRDGGTKVSTPRAG